MRRFVPGTLAVVLLVLPLAACSFGGSSDAEVLPASTPVVRDIKRGEDMAHIYLAGGCFWGVERYMSLIKGVTATQVGYANGTIEAPTYRDVTTGTSGYAETVYVEYDPTVAPLPFLLDLFYNVIEPTSLNRQGNDFGTQYRTGIYYDDPADAAVIEESLARLQQRFSEPVVIEAEPLTAFTPAEEYHQDYLEKNPGGYCHIDFSQFKKAEEAVPDPGYFAE